MKDLCNPQISHRYKSNKSGYRNRRIWQKFFLLMIITPFLVTLFPGPVIAENLFKSVKTSRSISGNLGVISEQVGVLDSRLLNSVEVTRSIGVKERELLLNALGKQASPVALKVEHGESTRGIFSLLGPAKNNTPNAGLAYREGRVSGFFSQENRSFRVSPRKDGTHAIEEIDQSQFPENPDMVFDDGPIEEPEVNASRSAGVKPESIDILMVFEKSLARSVDIELEAAAYIVRANQIYRRISDTEIADETPFFRLVGVRSVNYQQSESLSTDVRRLRKKQDLYLDEVHQWRDELGADLVSMIVPDVAKKVCGIAYVGPQHPNQKVNANTAFSVTAYECRNGFTFTHELGHNLGATHDRSVAKLKEGQFNYGLVDLKNNWRTIMAYYSACKQAGVKCPRIPSFSDARRQKDGALLGHPEGQSNAADNARIIAFNRNRVAAYRARKVALVQPSTPPTKPPVVPVKPAPPAPVSQHHEIRDCAECPVMIPVAAGEVRFASTDLGSDALFYREKVARDFALGKFEVSVSEYANFISESDYQSEAGCWLYRGTRWAFDPSASWRDPGFSQTPDDPVVCVNWHDAKSYADWLSKKTGKAYRLPSESEWTLAAQPADDPSAPWHDDEQTACQYGNVYDRNSAVSHGFYWRHFDCVDGYLETAPVGQFAANKNGFYDILGNVGEWTSDCWNETLEDTRFADHWRTKNGDCTKSVLKGGAWADTPSHVNPTNRDQDDRSVRITITGFRLLREQE
jgi:sulfatase modifying factor 1